MMGGMKFFLTVIGMVLIIEGIPYMLAPNQMKAWAKQIQEYDSRLIRVLGMLSLAAGVLLLFMTKELLD